jgi:hypothetical protein
MPESGGTVGETPSREEPVVELDGVELDGEGAGARRAVRRLRARWLEPSPPLPVDDEPAWARLPEAGDEAPDEHPASERSAH